MDENLIELVRLHEVIYDHSSSEYRDQNVRQQAWVLGAHSTIVVLFEASLSIDTKMGWYEDSVVFMSNVGERGLFSGVFVPPPPKPIFLDGSVKMDDPTTCDLCSWAWKRSKVLTTESSDIPNQVEWLFSLVIVSVVSASLGAIAMIFFFQCKRSKEENSIEPVRSVTRGPTGNIIERQPIRKLTDKEQIPAIIVTSNNSTPLSSAKSENSVWCWLSKKSSHPIQLQTISCSPVENHYTQMDEPHNIEEAVYAELDMECSNGENSSISEPYQNQAFIDSDIQVSSAQSSAYYSDLSVTPIIDRAYEVVNLSSLNMNWDNTGEQFVSNKLPGMS